MASVNCDLSEENSSASAVTALGTRLGSRSTAKQSGVATRASAKPWSAPADLEIIIV